MLITSEVDGIAKRAKNELDVYADWHANYSKKLQESHETDINIEEKTLRDRTLISALTSQNLFTKSEIDASEALANEWLNQGISPNACNIIHDTCESNICKRIREQTPALGILTLYHILNLSVGRLREFNLLHLYGKSANYPEMIILLIALEKHNTLTSLAITARNDGNNSHSDLCHLRKEHALSELAKTLFISVLKKNPALFSLHLRGYTVFLHVIPAMLENNTRLQALCLANCSINIDYAGRLGRALQQNTNSTLMMLKLGNANAADDADYCGCEWPISFNTYGIPKSVAALNDFGNNLGSLTALDLSNSSVGHNLISLLANHLATGTLLTLQLARNAITTASIKELMAALNHIPENPRFRSLPRTLNFYNCQLSDDSAKALADGLQTTTPLHTLILSRNFISHKGLEHLTSAIKRNPPLAQLDLSWNDADDANTRRQAIYDSSARQNNQSFVIVAICNLAEALQSNTNLTHLNLNAWRVEELCFACFSTALQKNYSLLELQLGDFDSRSEVAPPLSTHHLCRGTAKPLVWQAIQRNRNLQFTWAIACARAAFERANSKNALRRSVVPLIPSILLFSDLTRVVSTSSNSVNTQTFSPSSSLIAISSRLDKLMDTQFFQAHIFIEASTIAVATTTSNSTSNSSTSTSTTTRTTDKRSTKRRINNL